MTAPLLDQLASGPLLGDGAMGTMLYAKGVSFDQCFDQQNVINPALVAEIHRAYIEAGAQLIETNTFGANRLQVGCAWAGAPGGRDKHRSR